MTKYQLLADDEDGLCEDDLYRPKKTNKRKSLAPLFVYKILTERSRPDMPMRQQEILDILWMDRDFEIHLERKALSRIIHNLEDCHLGIRSHPRKGVWYEDYL